MTTPDRRSPTLRLGTAACVLAIAIAPCVWFVRALSGIPTQIIAAAAAPALVWAWLVTRIDRRHPEPWWALACALFAGAVLAASVSHVVNGWLLAWANTIAGEGGGRPLAGGFGAPVVEEIAKAAALLLLLAAVRHLVDGTLDGIIYGALVGIGFAFTENVIYLTFAVLQGGSGGLLRAVYVRALLAGGNHAAFTATIGAALGWAAGAGGRPGRLLVPAIGLVLAILQHVVWNAVAASAITGVLCGPELAGGPCRPTPTDTSLFVIVPILTAIFIGPGLVTLAAISVLTRDRAARTTAVAPQK
jgi:RsiW-degrading membrane proteinase PrsW (M82 family)